jgi:hypothetical protein
LLFAKRPANFAALDKREEEEALGIEAMEVVEEAEAEAASDAALHALL